MKKIIALLLVLVSIFTLVSCSKEKAPEKKYTFQYAFFPTTYESIPPDKPEDFPISEIDQKYIDRTRELLASVTEYINKKFGLNISKPMPTVKAYSPDWGASASYLNNTLYIDPSQFTSEDLLVHEIIHYLSDNGDYNIGFIHTEYHENNPETIGHGLTEGYTDAIAVMYCLENNLSIREGIISSSDSYAHNRNIANAYIMLEPQTVVWFFASDYQSMSNYIHTSLNTVATVPKSIPFNNTFDFLFYVYQDCLLDYGIGKRTDFEGYRLMYTSSYEIASITIRSCKNDALKNQIYQDCFADIDSNDVMKNMILA